MGKRNMWYLAIVALCVFGAGAIVTYASIPPADFPKDATMTIEKNMTLSQAADLLAKKDIIKSPVLFKAFVVMLGGNNKILAGDYLFSSAQSALRIAYRLVHGDQGVARIKVTIPEGIASPDIARLLAKDIPGFDSADFLKIAKPQEGYLFPDTYFFYENVTPQEVVDQMRANFNAQERKFSFAVTMSGRSEGDVVKMASILEKEATSTTDRRIIAGILWKRLADGMPLQVDPPFFYILGKTSSQLTVADLAVDSPYNLYKNKGLPPTPIGNPGLDAIEDALNPTATDYWFYLADAHGVTHYATNHEGHLANIQKYLQ
ncbi:MAG: endolytic transglycosylase MltG [Patescibacteria group bacterium]|nr:endolytic transglycosylase MltG [Patescibacteria group bacterium]MDE2233214.1 endolytic transglycosylase MltG [Patescibacteria group bacterium]